MIEETRFSFRIGAILIAIGLLAFIIFLFAFGVNPLQVADTVKKVNLFYFSLTFAALILSVAFYSLTWNRLLDALSVKVSSFKAFQFIWISEFINLMIPAESVSGDISRTYMMSKESGGNTGKIVASVVGHRILSSIITFVGFIISATYFVLFYSPPLLVLEFIVIIIVASILSLSFLTYLSIRKKSTEKIVNWILRLIARLSRGRWQFDDLKNKAERMLNAFHGGIQTLIERPKKLVSPLLFSFVAWLFDLLIVVLVFFSIGSFGVNISFAAIVIVYSIIIGIQHIPIGIPGEVGLVEIVMTALFTLLSSGDPIVISAVATSATLLSRILTFWTRIIIGGIAFQWLGIKGFKKSAIFN